MELITFVRYMIFSVFYDLSFAVTLQGILIDEHEVEQNVLDDPKEGKALDQYYPENYKTCIDFFLIFGGFVRSFGMSLFFLFLTGNYFLYTSKARQIGLQIETYIGPVWSCGWSLKKCLIKLITFKSL